MEHKINIIITDIPKSGCLNKNISMPNNNNKEICNLVINNGKNLIALY